jgi:hypothetical protein
MKSTYERAAAMVRQNPQGWVVDPARDIRLRATEDGYAVAVGGDWENAKTHPAFPTALMAVADEIARESTKDPLEVAVQERLRVEATNGSAKARAIDLVVGRMERLLESEEVDPRMGISEKTWDLLR